MTEPVSIFEDDLVLAVMADRILDEQLVQNVHLTRAEADADGVDIRVDCTNLIHLVVHATCDALVSMGAPIKIEEEL